MISQSTPCGSLRPEESWLGSKRQWREWELRWQTTWRSWRVSTTENPRSKDTSPGSIENWRKQTTLKCRERVETESESSRVYSLTSSLKDRQGSKPSPRTEQPSGPRSTESMRHSDGSSMKTPHWLSAFAPCFVSKELPSHRFSQPSAWRSRPLCLRSPAAGENAPASAPKPPDKSSLKECVGKKNTYRPSGVPWLI